MRLVNRVFILIFFFTKILIAQDCYWTGNGGDADFFNELNWVNTLTGQSPQTGSINPSQPIDFNLFLSCNINTNSVAIHGVDIASQTPMVFGNISNPSWPYVYMAATLGDGTNGAQQTFVINVTRLPVEGANYRVLKTVANGNWSQENPQALVLGLNTINVNAVPFDRTVKLQFDSGDVFFNAISLNENSVYSPPSQSLVMEASKTIDISDGTLSGYSISGGSLNLNDNSYVNLTANEPLLNAVQVNLNSNISWLRLDKVNPTLAYENFATQLSVFDAAANYPTTIRFDNYYEQGVVIRTQNSGTMPLRIYSNENLEGTETLLAVNQVYSGAGIPNQMNNTMRSFHLKKGYMLTLASNEEGTGKSKVFIASEEDLQIQSLPDYLIDTVSFLRITPWNWVSKKGTAGDIVGMDTTWFYKWNNQGTSDFQREYTPMSWGYGGADDMEDVNLYRTKYKATHVLGFNEPDDCNGQSGQYNNLCDVNVALGVYENLMKTGLRLVSPACRQGAAFDWLDTFNQQAIQNDIRIDVIAVHWYDWGSNPESTPTTDPNNIFNRFKGYLTAVHNLYGLPLWITEFNGNKYRTQEVNRQFMALAIPYLETLDYVERYAWFEPQNVTVPEDPGNAEFYDDAMNLTDIGLFYKNSPSTPSIPAPFFMGPDNLSNEVLVNDYEFFCEADNSLSNDQVSRADETLLMVLPNPASDKIEVLFSEPIYSVKLYTITGALIKKELLNGFIDISDLQKGVYFISVNHHYQYKFLKL